MLASTSTDNHGTSSNHSRTSANHSRADYPEANHGGTNDASTSRRECAVHKDINGHADSFRTAEAGSGHASFRPCNPVGKPPHPAPAERTVAKPQAQGRAGPKLTLAVPNLRITNDPSANQLLQREYRPGWTL
jgi:hypothetical protein